jgi:hypothetical protein
MSNSGISPGPLASPGAGFDKSVVVLRAKHRHACRSFQLSDGTFFAGQCLGGMLDG